MFLLCPRLTLIVKEDFELEFMLLVFLLISLQIQVTSWWKYGRLLTKVDAPIFHEFPIIQVPRTIWGNLTFLRWLFYYQGLKLSSRRLISEI